MGDADLEKAVAKTQELMGSLITRPPLTAKLLSRPPFKYLHNVITALIASHGFLKGLYTDEEMDPGNVTDKAAKIEFLTKAIKVTVLVTGKKVKAKPAKIVAGKEPTDTNKWLQLMALAIKKKRSSDDAVAKVLGGGEGDGDGQPEKKSSHADADADAAEAKAEEKKRRRRQKDESSQPSRRERPQSDPRRKRGGKTASEEHLEATGENLLQQQQQQQQQRQEDDAADDGSPPSQPLPSENAQPKGAPFGDADDAAKESHAMTGPGNDDDDDGQGDDGSAPQDPRAGPGTHRQPPQSQEEEREAPRGDTTTDDMAASERNTASAKRIPSATVPNPHTEAPLPGNIQRQVKRRERPSSARPAPPRVKRPGSNIDSEAISSRNASARDRAPTVDVIVAGDAEDEDDDEHFVVGDAANEPITSQTSVGEDASQADGDSGEQGALMRKILAKKQEGAMDSEGGVSRDDDAQRKLDRQHTQKEIEQLRASVQKLCQSTNPLGRLVDYLLEDVESMKKEMQSWKAEAEEYTVKMNAEELKLQESLQPLKGELADLTQQVADRQGVLLSLRANVLDNSEKIQRMLAGVSSA